MLCVGLTFDPFRTTDPWRAALEKPGKETGGSAKKTGTRVSQAAEKSRILTHKARKCETRDVLRI